MNPLSCYIDQLIALSIEKELISPRDTIYIRNRILDLYKEDEYEPGPTYSGDFYETLHALATLAVSKGLIEDSLSARDIFTSTLMDIFLPLPSLLEDKFFSYYECSPKKATDYFYKTSQAVNYIKMSRIAKNVFFNVDSPYGALDITINLSKPEKDPKEIARLKTAPPNKYPACLLCIENEGYAGTVKLPDRANHRTISLHINDRNWRLQYSPYLYYNEHCILLSETHEPMQLTKDSFYNLLGFVEQFPHYFIGSNADLPIVGGSILSHEHYQGGCYTFPIHNATTLYEFKMKAFPHVTCKLLNWPLSTIELSSPHLEAVAEATDFIYQKWMTYSDQEVGILASTKDIRHNTITPIAEKRGNEYVLKVVLRNNRTSTQHPLGIFHPHEDVQHIKKENIGLIEVMGLAILPGRLLGELQTIKSYIKGEPVEVATYHLPWAEELKKVYSPNEDLDAFLQAALGKKFTRVLEDAGVFKMTPEGLTHFKQFVESLDPLS